MNILHMVDMISQQNGGGSARVPWHLAKEQAKVGHRVAIYASNDGASMADAPPGVELRLFKCALNFMGGYRLTPTMLMANFRRFDIIHMHNYRVMTNLIAAIQGVPYVLQAHGSALPLPETRRVVTRPWKTVNDWLWQDVVMGWAQRLIACNAFEEGQYVAEGADEKRVVRTDLGIDLDDYSDIPTPRNHSRPIILYLGKFHDIKGPDVLVWAFYRLNIPGARLIMAGWDDGSLGETKRLVGSLGLEDRVEFVGFVDGPAKRQLYADADLYLLPSRYEAYGLCIQEACACGTPVILTDRCAIAGQIPDYCGTVVGCDEWALARAMREKLSALDEPAARTQRMAWARQYGWDRIAREMVKLYQEVLRD